MCKQNSINVKAAAQRSILLLGRYVTKAIFGEVSVFPCKCKSSVKESCFSSPGVDKMHLSSSNHKEESSGCSGILGGHSGCLFVGNVRSGQFAVQKRTVWYTVDPPRTDAVVNRSLDGGWNAKLRGAPSPGWNDGLNQKFRPDFSGLWPRSARVSAPDTSLVLKCWVLVMRREHALGARDLVLSMAVNRGR